MTRLCRFRVAVALLAFLLTSCAQGTTLRVATLNVLLGLGAPGTPAYEATVDILARLDADVVALQEIQDEDLSGAPSPLGRLSTALGYDSIHLAETEGVFDFKQRVGFLSRYPISDSSNITSPPGARDMTRQIPAVVVDVPGTTDDPTILTLHLKCCLELDDPFRRAVELHRLTRFLQSENLTSADRIVILGDFNLIGSDQVYNSLPPGLPATFALGGDLTFPVRYFATPAPYFAPWAMTALDARQLNGSRSTSSFGPVDFILATPALTNRPHQSEIYNSALDISNQRGLPKAGSPLPPGTSREASDHFAVFADFDLADPRAFTLTTIGEPVREDFADFDGSSDPARWSTSEAVWRGPDDGTKTVPGNYAYGSEPSLGFLLDGTPVSATAEFRNETGQPITALEIAYDAEQWRSSRYGTADQLSVELLIDDAPLPLPSLTFTAATSLPSGPVAGGATTPRATIVPGLSVPAGRSFQLRFTASPGSVEGGPERPEVFVNEFHYDNTNADTDEFLEVVVGPGYRGSIPEITLVFYNGGNGATYSTHPLDTFRHDHTTSSGHRIYSKQISGIQNGAPDGFALLQGVRVLQFLSYEGSFTAADGPAAGMTSTDIRVAQDDPIPAAGSQSLGLTGSGGLAPEFAWTRFAGPYTRGAANHGQTFTPPGPQGLAIDNLSVTPLADTDRDGDPDLSDPDDDNDGQSDLAETILTLTDPLDRNSRFVATVAPVPGNPTGVRVSFPTLENRTYTLERSHDLLTWVPLSQHPGDGALQTVPAVRDPRGSTHFFRIRVSMP